jgi:NTE family protein
MWDRLVESGERVELRAGDWLFRQADAGDSVHVVLSGRLQVVDEDDAVMRTLGRGDVVGELSAITGSPRSASVRAARDSALVRVGRETLLAALGDDPALAQELMLSLAGQLQRSRTREVRASARPSTIALVGVPRGDDLADRLCDALRRHTTLERVEAPGEPLNAAREAERVDRAERGGAQVLLVAPQAPPGDAWTAFCTREADRVVVHDARLRGDAVQRLARRLAGCATGVVLSGGGARALAHIGVLDELRRAGVEIDRVGGCSMGAFVGALFARGLDPDAIASVCRRELVDANPWSDYTLPVFSGLRGTRAQGMLERVLGPGDIGDLERPYFCVSTDLVAGELVVHDGGALATSVAASMCLPGITPPVALDGRLLVDGGLMDNLPVEAMATAGEGRVIAVDVTARRHRVTHARRPRLHDVIVRSMVLASRDTTEAAGRFADVLITPDVGRIGLRAFRQMDEAIALGRAAARRVTHDTQGS